MFSRIFIERPRLAMVISIVITLAGLISLFNIPVAQYPKILPPMITVQAFYPGANAQVIANTVAAPIEKEVNGTDKMLYMESTCSNDGSYQLVVTFAVGTDPDIDQVNLQNRVQLATPKLPREVVSQGIVVRKRAMDFLGVISFYSPDRTRDKLFLSNYVSRNVKDSLVRLGGVSDVFIFGQFEYSMRIWMNPDRLTALGLTADDVINAIRQQNVQAAVGSIGTAPAGTDQQIQYTLTAKGRLRDPKEFGNIIIRTNKDGGMVRVRDVARVELAAKTYGTNSILNGRPALGVAVYRATGANALDAMRDVRNELTRLSQSMPADVKYEIIYDSTKYVTSAIHEIEMTLGATFFLVLLVNFVFLQNWRATLVPTVVIPVSLIGTFAVLLAVGYSINTVSLFALIMAIGLVVDDSIVVVENVYRIMEQEKLPPREATIKAMGQVTGPIIATTLVLLAIFVPVAFLPGVVGELYKQFAVTISASVSISTLCALSLSPAMCALFLKPHRPARRGPFAWFNWLLDHSRKGYVAGSRWLIRRFVVVLLIFVGIFWAVHYLFITQPKGFLPQEDQGVFFVNVQLPEGATISRTSSVIERATKMIQGIKGVNNIMGVAGFSLLSGRSENVGFVIVILKPWQQRTTRNTQLGVIVGQTQGILASVSAANIFVFAPPPIMGLGSTGGFDFRLQALRGQSPQDIAAVTRSLVMAANQDPVLMRVFSTYTADTPQIFVKLNRDRAEQLKVPVNRIFRTLQAQLGSAYVNDFDLYGRVYQVKVQADIPYRKTVQDLKRLYVRSDTGHMVPVSSLVTLSTILGPQLVKRYNQFTSTQINGNPAPGFSSADAMAAMKRVAAKTLPDGYSYDWSSISFQQHKSSGKVLVIFVMALVFAYLFLVGQYESWNLPLAIIVYIPVAILGALLGLWFTGISISLYAQIGLVLLVGLASKNAILIVEFARDRHEEGLSVAQAAVEGASIRFRPVLMTAFTFILGVAPMVIATGAGANSRRHIGTTVFSGMLIATMVGLFLIPSLYYIFQVMREKFRRH